LARNAPTVFSESALASDPDARVFLKSLWRTLPEELALIGVHYYIDGLTTAEIGRMLGVSDRTVATRLRTLEQSARREAGEEPGP
jgi:DNA-directed RNA polymerase specialized sigma24 family protein